MRSETARPISACFRTATICSVEKRFFFIGDLLCSKGEIRQKTKIKSGPFCQCHLSYCLPSYLSKSHERQIDTSFSTREIMTACGKTPISPLLIVVQSCYGSPLGANIIARCSVRTRYATQLDAGLHATEASPEGCNSSEITINRSKYWIC